MFICKVANYFEVQFHSNNGCVQSKNSFVRMSRSFLGVDVDYWHLRQCATAFME
jgi:hypothetical protein